MNDYIIKVQRSDDIRGFLSSSSVGTDALNGLSSIPGVQNLEVVDESECLVTLRFQWAGGGEFHETDEHLKRFGVCRAWPCAGTHT